jgi:hypothetical protein
VSDEKAQLRRAHPRRVAATAAVLTAQGIDLAADITWREALHELIQARTQIRRCTVDSRQRKPDRRRVERRRIPDAPPHLTLWRRTP